MEVVNSEDAPKLTADVQSQSAHESHCERAWLNIVPVLRRWLGELAALKASSHYTSFPCFHLPRGRLDKGSFFIIFDDRFSYTTKDNRRG